MHNTRTAAEYRTAAGHLWERAAGATLSRSHDAFADLAVIYETLADQGEAAEKEAASVSTATTSPTDWAASSNVLRFVPRRAP
jgi:hypothetical protein